MDPEGRAVTRAIVAGLRDAGVAILLTSHDLSDVERMADRVCILDRGRLVASGTPAALAAGARPRLRFRLDRALDDDRPAGLGLALRAVHPAATLVREPDEGYYRVDGVEPDAGLVAALATWCAASDRLIVELRTTGGTLEEIYLELVGAGDGEVGRS
jgi:ABC-2 type transport system ATP-binding protein